MRIVCEDFVCDGINILVCVVLCEVEFDQIGLFEWCSVDRVCVMFYEPSYYVFVVEDQAFGCADWGYKGLQAQGTECEW